MAIILLAVSVVILANSKERMPVIENN